MIQGKTPLMFASKNGSFEIVEFLLNKGADINSIDNQRKRIIIEKEL